MRSAAIVLVVLGAAGLIGCGGEGRVAGEGTTAAIGFEPLPGRVVRHLGLTAADRRRIRDVALHNHFVHGVASGSRVRILGRVAPVVSVGGRKLLGGAVELKLSPAVEFEDLRLPATISPNEKAPSGTPTLFRFVRMSANHVGELEVEVRLAGGRPVRIEPSGDGYEVTKLELIGPPPTSSAYAPEPGR
jgi:hypothetical protein